MKKTKHPLMHLLSMMGNSNLIFIAAMSCLAVAVLIETLGNLIIRYIIDDVLLKNYSFKALVISGMIFLMLAVLRGVFFFLEGKGKAKTAENVVRNLRQKVYDHIQRLSFKYHDNTDSGELVQRATSDIDAVRRFYMDQIPELLKIALLYVINLSVLLYLEWRLALAATISTPIMIVVSRLFFVKIFDTYDDYQNHEAKMTSKIKENLSGIRIVRAFARQTLEKDKFKQVNDSQRRLGFRHILWHNLYWPFAHSICSIQFISVLLIGAYMVIKNQISTGTFVAFASMVNSLIWPLQEFGRVITELSKSYVSYKRVDEILTEEQEELSSLYTQVEIKGELVIKDLCFSYAPANRVLDGINVSVAQGEKIALLGSTGSGKTTLMNLLPRFYDYTEGQILLDGIDLKKFSKKQLRQNIGIVEQEPFLFSMSIRDNIAYSLDRSVTQFEIENAARAAAIHDSIVGLPQGYATEVGENGVTLSGGQKQRITIARTLLKDPKILILDDSTSAVDAHTEEKIRIALMSLMKGRTTFIIAHRIQTLQMADRIIVMHEGKIVQVGTHQELIQQKGFYKNVFNLQTQIEDQLRDELSQASCSA